MDALGMIMAMLFSWSMIGVGLVLTVKGAIGLVPRNTRISLVAGYHNESGTSLVQELTSKIMLAAGMFLIYVGGSGTFGALFG